jgi:hypothetical protein
MQDTKPVCAPLSYVPFPELEDGFLDPRPILNPIFRRKSGRKSFRKFASLQIDGDRS